MNFLLAAIVYGSVLFIWVRHYLPGGGSPFGPEDVDAMAKIIKLMWFRLLPAFGVGYVLTSIVLGMHVLKTRHGTSDS